MVAWETLIVCVERNGGTGEAVRLAEELLREQPESPEAASIAAHTFCNNLLLDRAWHLLSPIEQRLDLKSAVRFGQLCLIKDPRRAKSVFTGIVSSHPDVLEASLGIINASSILVGHQTQTIGFFLFDDWNRPIQKSVFDACVGASMRSVMTTNFWLIRALAPRVLVISDTPLAAMVNLRLQLPETKIVHTRHGFADKNFAFYAAGRVDFVCASSQAIADEYVRNGVFDRGRFWITGYPQLDPLFAKLKAQRKRTPGRTVLFAPTFTKGLSAGIRLGVNAVKMIRGGDESITVLIKPHPNMRQWNKDLLKAWQIQANHSANLEFHDDPDVDIAELMLRSDLLISDVSSAALSFLALDRPIICLDGTGEGFASPYFAPDGIEWQMRDAVTVCSGEGLALAVQTGLADPSRKSAERRKVNEHLFGNLTDGRAGQRIAKQILALQRQHG